MDVKPGYKQTEIGIIPNDWKVEPLGREVRGLEAGVSVNSVDDEPNPNEPAILKTSAVENGNFLPWESKKIVQRDLRRATLNPRAETILISRMNTIDLVGECGYVDRDYPNLFVPDRLWMTRFRAGSQLSAKWLSYVLSSASYRRALKEIATGTSGSMKNITKGSLFDLRVAFPQGEEQRAIAGALSDVDALLGALHQLIAKKRDLKQAAMQQLLTGQARLPGFHSEWEVKRLGDVVDFANGKPHEGHIDPTGQYYLVTLDSIGIDGKLKAEHRPIGRWDNSLLKDDIVTILSDIAHGNLLGLCDLIPEDNLYVLNQRVGRLRVKPEVKASQQFLRLQINRRQDHFKKRGQGTSQRHIYRRDFDQLELELPPLPEQTAIAEVLTDMDAELAAMEQRSAKTRALKQGMMQELLTGRTRLV